MTPSTTLPLKISKTKKRLSETQILWPLVIAQLGLLAIMGFTLRLTTMTWDFAEIRAEIPLIAARYTDAGFHRFQSDYKYSPIIDGQTITIALTKDAYLFGSLRSFTEEFVDVRKRFMVPHRDGAPQLGVLLDQIQQWTDQSKTPVNTKLAVFFADADIPMPIVIQTIGAIRSKGFSRVVLGGGLL